MTSRLGTTIYDTVNLAMQRILFAPMDVSCRFYIYFYFVPVAQHVTIETKISIILKSRPVDYPIYEWKRIPSSVTFTGVIKDAVVPTGAKYLLLFTSDLERTPLAKPYPIPINGLRAQEDRGQWGFLLHFALFF